MPVARTVAAVLVTLFVMGCGSADSTGLSGPADPGGASSAGTAGAPPGAGGTAAGGTGAASATGGFAGSIAACTSDGDCGVGRACVANACVDVMSAGGTGGSGMAGMGGIGTGGVGTGGVGTGGMGTGGTPVLPGGAWAPCSNNNECLDGRICTSTIQSFVVPGRSGACVQQCNFLQPNACDPPPPGGTVDCTQILFTGYCSIICSDAVPCPAGFDCVTGYCFWQ